MTSLLSIVVPCYNEEKTILPFYQEIIEVKEQLAPLKIEFIFVNDGSIDQTLSVLKELERKDPIQVNYLSFSRNFGKEAALFAGLQHASGDFVTVMDADLQDPPKLLPKMYQLIEQGDYDCVGTRRTTRVGEPKVRSFFAKKFYQVINKISDVEIVDGARDYRLMTRQMVDAILELKEYNRFSKGLFSWVGFNVHYIEYDNIERQEGESSWSFRQLFMYSLDGIIAFSEFPLIISAIVGITSFVIAILALLFIFIRATILGDQTTGWPSLVCIILALGGLQLFCLGILGQYLGKTFLETKKRPIYILKEKSNFNKNV
ncbi:glycosyltransferase family 2 protein [Vagococcus fluvialis]|uniref:glycosyltransferase family 2 protein n=1 Tax=Vagococcus fluvialis TaxID=2738 RepID=UPI001D0AF4EC|nr:glycosyltransferase family 2 protein [Vagococcus fluvialis]UDM73831.1 glycosyltransferase family 2 protein [Vagococcus fluvialis]